MESNVPREFVYKATYDLTESERPEDATLKPTVLDRVPTAIEQINHFWPYDGKCVVNTGTNGDENGAQHEAPISE